MRTQRFAILLVLSSALLLGGCVSAKKTAHRKKAPVTPEQQLALKEYHLGIDAYTNSRYAEAIKHWQVTVAKDPENDKAPEYIERAETMLKALGKKVPVKKK